MKYLLQDGLEKPIKSEVKTSTYFKNCIQFVLVPNALAWQHREEMWLSILGISSKFDLFDTNP